ncbi:MAG: hypothetical protein CM1200mP12_20730 [Gammaproteobacteria bacterium]|nr:MAG: hypothetical protein CM1200mP12_20730 [Gammaproteobacteria bacterium]
MVGRYNNRHLKLGLEKKENAEAAQPGFIARALMNKKAPQRANGTKV